MVHAIANTKENRSSWKSYDYTKTINELILKTIKQKYQEIDDQKKRLQTGRKGDAICMNQLGSMLLRNT